MDFYPISDFFLYQLKIFFNALSFFISVFYLTNFQNITFLYSRVSRNLSSSSTVYFVPLSLAAFSYSLCSYISLFIFKLLHLFKIYSIGLFYQYLLTNQALGTFPLYDPVLHNQPISLHNSTLLSTFLHGPSIPCFGQKLSLLNYL